MATSVPTGKRAIRARESVAGYAQSGVDLVGERDAARVGVAFGGVEVVHDVGVADAVFEVDEAELPPDPPWPKIFVLGPFDAALVEHVAQAPAVVGDARAEHEVGVEAALGDPDISPCARSEDLAVSERVVEGRKAERGDVGVGGREFGCAPQRRVSVEPSSSSGMKPIATENAAIGCSSMVAGSRARLPLCEHVADVGLVDHLGAAVVLAWR